MSAASGSPVPGQPDRLDSDLRKLKELDESLAERDKRIVSALRRLAKRLDSLQRKTRA